MSERDSQLDDDGLDGFDGFPVASGPEEQQIIEWLLGGRGEEPVHHSCEATLIPEARPAGSPAAVAVFIGGMRVGLLDSEASERLTLALQQWNDEDVSCNALIVGGWYRSTDDKGDFQVLLDVSATRSDVPYIDDAQGPQAETGRKRISIVACSMLMVGGIVLLLAFVHTWLGDSYFNSVSSGPSRALIAGQAFSSGALSASLSGPAPRAESPASAPKGDVPDVPPVSPAAIPAPAKIPEPVVAQPALESLSVSRPSPSLESRGIGTALPSDAPTLETLLPRTSENETPTVTAEANEPSAVASSAQPPNNSIQLATAGEAGLTFPTAIKDHTKRAPALHNARTRPSASRANHRAKKWAQTKRKKGRNRIYYARQPEARIESDSPVQRDILFRPPAARMVDDAFKEFFAAPRSLQLGPESR